MVICQVRLPPRGAGLGVALEVTRRSAPMLLPRTARQAENSEVLLAGSVAVALTKYPAGIARGMVLVKATLPFTGVVTFWAPRNVFPSPSPEALQAGLAK